MSRPLRPSPTPLKIMCASADTKAMTITTQPWPADNECASFEAICDPFADAIRSVYELTRVEGAAKDNRS
jgi:hypothetical protein